MQSFNILVKMRIHTIGVIVSGVNAEKERFGDVQGLSNRGPKETTLVSMNPLLVDYESDFQPRLLTKIRNNDQSICRKQPNGSFGCPEIKEENVIMAIQRDWDPLPHFDRPQPLDGLAKEDWAQTYPALKIHSSGRSLLFMYDIKTISWSISTVQYFTYFDF